MRRCLICLAGFGLLATFTRAETLTIQTGDTAVQSATARANASKTSVDATVTKDKVQFDKLLPGERYDVSLQTPTGQQLRLLDVSWYADLAPEPADPMDDDDRAAINEILSGIKAFTNKNTILQLAGDSQHAVAIVELIRDTDFHARSGDEIIWRIEVWYFENQAGGWAKVQQQNRVIERERFKSAEEFEARRKKIQWIGIASGLKITRGENATIGLPKK